MGTSTSKKKEEPEKAQVKSTEVDNTPNCSWSPTGEHDFSGSTTEYRMCQWCGNAG